MHVRASRLANQNYAYDYDILEVFLFTHYMPYPSPSMTIIARAYQFSAINNTTYNQVTTAVQPGTFPLSGRVHPIYFHTCC